MDRKSKLKFIEKFFKLKSIPNFRDICINSNKDVSDTLFFTWGRGLNIISELLYRGVAAIIIEEDVILSEELSENNKIIRVKNVKKLLAEACAEFYEDQPENCLAVTGTNGKTSVVNITRQLFEGLNKNAASMGSLGLKVSNLNFNDEIFSEIPSMTTLDSVNMHKVLKYLKNKKIPNFIFEASSHGLSQYRIHGVKLKAAAFTNLTYEHMKYHKGSMEDYFEAKSRLFSEILPIEGFAIFNYDSPYYSKLKEIAISRNQNIFSFSLKDTEADIALLNLNSSFEGLTGDLWYLGKKIETIKIPLLGLFQADNLLVALGFILATGIKLEEVLPVISNLSQIKGRMEFIGKTKRGASVFIDYAHTPDGLLRALNSLTELTIKRKWLLYGVGDVYDINKSSLMGEVANDHCDEVVVTNSNTYFGDGSEHRQASISTCSKAHEIADRKEAISFIIKNASEGDSILIAGKGHDEYIIMGTKHQINDYQIAYDLMNEEY